MNKYPWLMALSCLLLTCGCVQDAKPSASYAPSSADSPISSSSTITTSSTLPLSLASTTSSMILVPEKSPLVTSTSSTSSSISMSPSTSTPSTPEAHAPKGITADIKLQKDTFHSGESMNIEVVVSSPERIEDIGVRIYGIYARNYRLNQSATVTLEKGLNDVQFTYKTPPCNTCAGIAAGKYMIKAEIVYNDVVSTIAMKDVDLMQ